MKLVRLLALGAMVAASAGCSRDTDGDLIALDPLSGLRYVNLVADTGAMDFRIIDIVGDAPNTVGATFRTGGAPNGVTNPSPTQPPYLPVRAGTRHIRVFMNGTSSAVASTIMFDTTFAFVANTNYTMFLYGYSRTGQGGVQAIITSDVVPTIAAGQFAVRVVHLAPSVSPTLGSTNVDVFVDTLAAAATPIGSAQFANVAFGEVRPYLTRTVRLAAAGPPAVTAWNYRAAYTATATLTPFVQGDVPNGTVGTSTVNPAAGDLVAGSAFSIVLVPPSVTGSPATNFTTPSAIFLIDQKPPRTAP